MQELSTSGVALSMHLVIFGHREQLRPIPPRARLLLRKCRQAHSTTEQHKAHALNLAGREDSGHASQAVRTLAMRTLLYARPQLCSSHDPNAFQRTCHAQLLSRHICTKQSPPSHVPLLQLAFAHTSACSLVSAASEHFAHKHCCTQTTFTCILIGSRTYFSCTSDLAQSI